MIDRIFIYLLRLWKPSYVAYFVRKGVPKSPRKNHRRKSDLHQYRQYVHQMKAENILNSNLTWKSRICYIKVGGNQFFMISPNFRQDFFFRNENFSKFFINNPQFFFHPHVHKMLNDKYMRFDNPSHLIHRMPSNWMSCGQIVTPPGLLRVKNVQLIYCPPWIKSVSDLLCLDE